MTATHFCIALLLCALSVHSLTGLEAMNATTCEGRLPVFPINNVETLNDSCEDGAISESQPVVLNRIESHQNHSIINKTLQYCTTVCSFAYSMIVDLIKDTSSLVVDKVVRSVDINYDTPPILSTLIGFVFQYPVSILNNELCNSEDTICGNICSYISKSFRY